MAVSLPYPHVSPAMMDGTLSNCELNKSFLPDTASAGHFVRAIGHVADGAAEVNVTFTKGKVTEEEA